MLTITITTSGSCIICAEDFGLANDLADQVSQEARGDYRSCSTRKPSRTACIPMDDRSFERLNADRSPVVPDIMADRKELTLYPGMPGMSENIFIDTSGRSLRHRPPI